MPEKGAETDRQSNALNPIAKTQFASKFSVIDVWMDLQSHMPVRIDTTDPNSTPKATTSGQSTGAKHAKHAKKKKAM